MTRSLTLYIFRLLPSIFNNTRQRILLKHEEKWHSISRSQLKWRFWNLYSYHIRLFIIAIYGAVITIPESLYKNLKKLAYRGKYIWAMITHMRESGAAFSTMYYFFDCSDHFVFIFMTLCTRETFYTTTSPEIWNDGRKETANIVKDFLMYQQSPVVTALAL